MKTRLHDSNNSTRELVYSFESPDKLDALKSVLSSSLLFCSLARTCSNKDAGCVIHHPHGKRQFFDTEADRLMFVGSFPV